MIHDYLNLVLLLAFLGLHFLKPEMLKNSLVAPGGFNITPERIIIVLLLIFTIAALATSGGKAEFFDVSQFKDCKSCTMNEGCWSNILKTCSPKVDVPLVGPTCGLATEKQEQCPAQ
jgi:hypothetical protein